MAGNDIPEVAAYPLECAVETLLLSSASDSKSTDDTHESQNLHARWRPWVIWLLVLSTAVLVRGAVMLNGHSGQDKPPMHGDFEAQRHWMEITLHLLPGEWYRHSAQNDLQYWGLDYPVLTAYTSLAFGKVAQVVHPALVAWEASRGYEAVPGKLFMRLSVLATDALVWLPAIMYFISCLPSLPLHRRIALAATLMLSPALLVIDHGHFQYNSTSLGLALAAFAAFGHERFILAALLFTLALNFKQMTLYYSLVVFVALLHAAVSRRIYTTWNAVTGVAALGATVVAVCVLLWLPLCVWNAPDATCSDAIGAMLQRQFPFDRSLFEDKVSNIWCVAEPLLRFRQRIYADATGAVRTRIAQSSAIVTLALALPPLVLLWQRRLRQRADVSCAFFLASYQVHEKTVLIVWLPIACLAHRLPLFAAWFSIMAAASMWPLLAKDGLLNATTCISILYAVAAWPSSSMVEAHDAALVLERWPRCLRRPSVSFLARSLTAVAIISIACVVATLLAALLLSPPRALPDLFPYAAAVFCAACFTAAMVASWMLLLEPTVGDPQVLHEARVDDQQAQAVVNDPCTARTTARQRRRPASAARSGDVKRQRTLLSSQKRK